MVGVVAASIVKNAVLGFFRLAKLEKWLKEAKVSKTISVKIWSDIIAELLRWTTIVLFLVPAVEAWGVPRVTAVLNQLLLYIPNVFVAVIIGMIGVVVARITSDVVYHGSEGLGSSQAKALASLAYYSLIFFTVLIVLNQLGVAADLVRILFTGIVAMLAIAGGLAFGLGGKDLAKDLLERFRKNLG